MRAKLALAIVAGLTMFVAQVATSKARPRPTRNSKQFEANKGFGLGLMLGEPTGLTGKYYLSKDTALDFAIGRYGRYGRDQFDNALHIHVDFLWHPVVLADPPAFWLPLYFGVGGRLLDHYRNDRDFSDDVHLGVRAPLGIMMDFNTIPLDIFLEVALIVDLIQDDHGYADLNTLLGARYYFN
ncbi:MAG: hypothetical protein GY811_18820 [Myxococcales bacterium]|nr:hypothetical protein [Myxococcales bacterium]